MLTMARRTSQQTTWRQDSDAVYTWSLRGSACDSHSNQIIVPGALATRTSKTSRFCVSRHGILPKFLYQEDLLEHHFAEHMAHPYLYKSRIIPLTVLLLSHGLLPTWMKSDTSNHKSLSQCLLKPFTKNATFTLPIGWMIDQMIRLWVQILLSSFSYRKISGNPLKWW